MRRLWDKGMPMDQKILAFTVGEDYLLDARLVRYDVQASIAHVTMLAQQNLLPKGESEQLVQALQQAAIDFENDQWNIELDDEDGHTALEKRLTEKLGYLGGKVHLGRSRNDQVLTALRLYMRAAIHQIQSAADSCIEALDHLAEQNTGVTMPGYTHLQQAMPSSVSDWALGYASELKSNLVLLESAGALASLNPLGSAAGFGTPGLELNRDATTEMLGFSETQTPVTACQLSRGKAESALAFAITQLLNDLGRMSADLCLFASKEFGFVKLADEISTGSSIMPQKRNPDVFELLRAQSTQATADLQAILGITAKMTSGYHRDLQLIKAPLFRTIDRALQCLEIATYALRKITFDRDRLSTAMDPGIHAAEAAFRLVQSEGISFREAYQRVASTQE